MASSGETVKLVLVIDDDATIREMLMEFVVQGGFRAEGAVDGEDGLRKAMSLKPDLIFLDLMLPRYGGFELLRQFKANGLSSVPIVIVTGRSTDRPTVEMIRQEANVVEFFEKPVKPNVLAMTLQRLLNPSAAASEAS
ncbi:MAG: response regulator [Elusimicrobia bacterium]|nr:response regulator [Elusimicrobiota bacterium]